MFAGYEFDKGFIFNKYVEDLYEIKINSPGVKRSIAKLGLNALYGKMGSRPSSFGSIIADKDTDIDDSILGIINLTNKFQ